MIVNRLIIIILWIIVWAWCTRIKVLLRKMKWWLIYWRGSRRS